MTPQTKWYRSEKGRAWRKIRTSQALEFVNSWKQSHGCIDCGETDPIVLDCDHRDPKTKKYGIAKMCSYGFTLDRIMTELKKCDIRCANCHRRKTKRNNDWLQKGG